MPVSAVNALSPEVLNAINGNLGTKDDTASSLQNNFMTLLVTQLKNQDPLNPMDNSEMTSQLTQINTLSQIQNLNKTLNHINDQINTGRTMQAAGLIGKGVLVPGDQILVGADGTATPFGFKLDQAVGNLKITISNQSGATIRQFELGAQPAGLQTYYWDGKDKNGATVDKGAYHVSVEAVDNDGHSTGVPHYNYALVTGVINGKDGAMLDLGGVSDPVSLDQVQQIIAFANNSSSNEGTQP